MKRNYISKIIGIALLTGFSFKGISQIAGVVTINSASVTAGTNYQTFNALASVLNSLGVTGPLVVNVVASSGPYNEQVNFNQIPGMSSTNTITINGNGCTLSFNATSATSVHTLMYSGADYITLNNLNVVGLGTTYALVCHLWNGSDNNTFNGCTFTAPLAATATGCIPFSLSGSGTSGTTAGNCGNNNVVSTSTMSGGYYNTVIYGNSTTPYNTNNKIQNSYMVDFYLYGCYNVYCLGTIVKGNVIERMNRTTTSTVYGIYFSTGSTANGLIEGNHIRRLFNLIPASTSAVYCIYVSAAASLGSENVVRNNIISDINSNGSIYGIYLPGSFALAYHNTLSFDDATATAGLLYAMYLTGSSNTIRNNIVYISRGGSGVKYNLYISGSSIFCNNNVLINNSTSGTNAIGFSTAAYTTLSNWQSNTTFDQNSVSSDPLFANPSAMNYAPTNIAVNNIAYPVGVATDFYNTNRSLSSPDPGAIEIYTTPCSGVTGTNSVLTPTVNFCPTMTANINIANTYTTAGYTYQWLTSTISQVGPFTSIPGATLITYNTNPLTQNVYYSAIVTCANTNQSITISSGSIAVAGVTYSNIPYYESFESLTPNKLPNCSWSASNQNATTLTQTVSNNGGRIPRTGNNFATFYNSPATVNFFYTNGLNLKAGVTYSASLWYITDLLGSTNWTDLSILYGTSQSPTGLTTIVSSNGPAQSPNHKSLSNTFTVPTTGVYYVAVRGTASAGAAAYLSWDDLFIEVPCTINEPYLNIVANYTNACSGSPFYLSATGANSYTWSTGAVAQAVTVTPLASTTSYSVNGTSTLSGCTKSTVLPILVNLSPQVSIFSGNSEVCAGSSITLTAVGAITFNWNNGINNAVNIVSPLSSTNYTVMGINAAGCTNTAAVQIVVNPLPVPGVAVTANKICLGESITLVANGATTYQWLTGPGSILLGNQITVNPSSSRIFTLIATSAKGCNAYNYQTIEVNDCTNLQELEMSDTFNLFPNPSSGIYNFDTKGLENSSIEIVDNTGKVITKALIKNTKGIIDLSNYSSGIYLIKVSNGAKINSIKVIKQD